MRTDTQLKTFLVRVLIVLATTSILTDPQNVTGAGQLKNAAAISLTQDALESGEVLRPTLPGAGGRAVVSRMQTKDTRMLIPDNSASFLPVVAYGSGGFPVSAVAVADVNGDGKPDLVAANSYACSPPLCTTGTVGVLLGKGDGTFQAPVSYGSGGSQTSSIAVADVASPIC